MIGIAQINSRLPVLLIWLLSVAWLPTAHAQWAQTEKSLAAWDGNKTIDFIMTGDDRRLALESLELLRRLVSLGYQITLGRHADSPDSALELRLTVTNGMATLVLNRTRDGMTIGAEQRQLAGATATNYANKTVRPASRPSVGNFVPDRRIDLNQQPLRIVSLNQPNPDILRVALLDSKGLSVYDIDNGQVLKSVAEFRPPDANLDALYLDAGDIDADGNPEIVAVWGENNLAAFDGIDTRLHAWILALDDDALRPVSDDLQAYLRINNNTAYLQRRGVYEAFAGKVYQLEGNDGAFSIAKTLAFLGLSNIYRDTPIDDASAFSFDDNDRLLYRSGFGQPQTEVTSAPYSDSLGEITFPVVYVKLEQPEYPLGLAESDRVLERAVPLARRVQIDGDIAYTQVRGRNTSLFRSKAEGTDRIVAVDIRSGRMTEPFAAVGNFILDFTVRQDPNNARVAILLLNDKPDGSGRSSLRIQQDSTNQ